MEISNISLYSLLWVIPRRLNFMCRRFGTPRLLHLHRRCKQEEPFLFRPRKITQKKENNIQNKAKF